MSLDLSSLLAQAPLRKLRRPVAERMLSIQVRDVRPLVAVNQQTIHLPQMGDSLSLLWRWRSGGCLGPAAAATTQISHGRGLGYVLFYRQQIRDQVQYLVGAAVPRKPQDGLLLAAKSG